MSNNYLKNLLNKSTQAQSIVEPRLKSRFEDGSGLSHDAGFADTFEKEDTSIQKRHPNIENSSEENNKYVSETHQTINFNNSEEKINDNKHENQTKFLNATENHFHSLENKDEEHMKENMGPMLSKSKDIENESAEISIQNPKNNSENRNFGILNKPVKDLTKTEKGFNGNNVDTKENILTAPVQTSIKISIGRVEVKAVKDSRKVPVKLKTKPNLKLSLEDYIDKRK